MSHAIFGYPHGDPLNSYYDSEAREERYQEGREQRQRVGEAAIGETAMGQDQTKGQTSDKLPATSNGR